MTGHDLIAPVRGLHLFLLAPDLGQDDRPVLAGVRDKLPEGLLERTAEDVHAGLLVAVGLDLVERLDRVDESDLTAGDHAFLDARAGGRECVLDTVLLLFELHLGGCADLDDGDAAGELRETLLELLLVEVAGGLFDLRLDLLHAGQDLVLVAMTLDEGRLVLGRRDAASAAEILDRGGVELAAGLFGDDLAAGEDRDVLEHRLATVTEARRLDAEHVERAAQLVHHEGRERLAVDVLADDDEVL